METSYMMKKISIAKEYITLKKVMQVSCLFLGIRHIVDKENLSADKGWKKPKNTLKETRIYQAL
jgi:hypothetical protein